MQVKFKIYRFDPENDDAPHYRTYEVEAEPFERILDCLNRIKWEQDGTLSFRHSCAHGVCGSDAMRINGVCALACQKLVKDYQSEEVVVEPLPNFRVVKDLIVDLEPFFHAVASMKPYLSASDPPEKERLQSPEERKKIDDACRCILCACCTSACPVIAEKTDFIGPAACVQAARMVFDSRDEHHAQRLRQLDRADGLWPCRNFFECTRVCPRAIPVTKLINLMKRTIDKTQ